MADYGPNDALVRRLIDRARDLSGDDARTILEARMTSVTARAANDTERTAMRTAQQIARRSKRFDAYLAARQAASQAFRLARRGEVGPWLGVSASIANAAGAAVIGDLLDIEVYEQLYRPWREGVSGGTLVPVGPGPGRSAFGVAKRRRPGVPVA